MAPDAAIATARPPPGRQLMIVLEPVAHPELAAIHIHDPLFAIGRTEAPFASYAPELAGSLSRRHARIFCEDGAVYLADLGSKNGTTLNGVAVKQAISRLQSGDVLAFGKVLSYRVQLEAGAVQLPRARLASLTLTPDQDGTELQSIVVTEFPFMISKADATFARYRETNPAQVHYLSRRHAHFFLKGGQPFVEDLGSTNGTFVNGARLEEHAEALSEDDVLAFGGHHFVYRLSMEWEVPAPDPTLTQFAMQHTTRSRAAADADKTTFVAAADSFLNIFCAEPPPAKEETPAAVDGAQAEDAAAPQGKAAVMLSGLYTAFGGKGKLDIGRVARLGLLAVAAIVLLTWALLRIGGAEREAASLLADGAYAQAAAVANEGLASDPGNGKLRALGLEAQIKALLPSWMAAVKARKFQDAAAQVAAMRQQGRNNPELAPLLAELDWIGQLEAFVAARGGAQAPVRDAADAARIQQFSRQLEEQNAVHQRVFVTISSHVPAFRDTYADALSDLRKLALAGGQNAPESTNP